MAMPALPQTQPQTQPQHGQARWRPVLVLAAAVLAWHGWMIGSLAPAGWRTAATGPGLVGTPVQWRVLPPTSAAPVDTPPPALLDAEPTSAPAAPRRARTAAAAVRAVPQAAQPAAGARADQPPPQLPAIASTPATASPPATAAAAVAATAVDAAAMATSDAGDSAEPPPLYPTQLPAPALLRYALHHNGHAGEAVLAWRHDGQAYHLALDGSTPAGAPLLAQASNGLVDANGLAPQRFVDRRRSGAQQAANFRRDIGRIGYSGPAQQHPAWPGAQDRLSALVQLAAVLAADPGLAEVQLFVADARGTAAPWRLVRQGDAPDTAGAIGARPWWPADLQLWQREPLRPEGLRVQVWMAALADTAAGRWPLRLRYTALRSGDVLELNLLAPPQPLP